MSEQPSVSKQNSLKHQGLLFCSFLIKNFRFLIILTSQPCRTLAPVPTGHVDALAAQAWSRQTFVYVVGAEFALSTLGTHTQVLPTAGGKVNIRHT